MERKRNTIKLINKTNLFCRVFFFFFIFLICELFSCATGSAIAGQDTNRCPMFDKADVDFQAKEKMEEVIASEGKTEVSLGWARRILIGLGSSPPRCTSKCGKCTPCSPVHVPVPPGTPVTAEYYPEAWRCKCGNKLYMP